MGICKSTNTQSNISKEDQYKNLLDNAEKEYHLASEMKIKRLKRGFEEKMNKLDSLIIEINKFQSEEFISKYSEKYKLISNGLALLKLP